MTTVEPGSGQDLWLDMIATGLAPEKRDRRWLTPGEMAATLDRSTKQTPALDLIDEKLRDVAEGRCERLMISMPPQEGKSQRVSRRFPEFMLWRNPNLRIAIVSSGLGLARGFGGAIRDDLAKHPELALTLSESTRAKHEFQLRGYRGGLICVGVEGSLVGRPVDLLIVDDPYKDAKQADSKAWEQTVRNFWTEVAVPRLAPKAPVVLVQTRWRQNDLAGWLQDEGDDWTVVNIPAQADHDPAKGETDVLGREPGEFMLSTRDRSIEDWAKKRREVGSRTWNAQYQGRPSPAEGGILQRGWWKFYEQVPWVQREDGSKVSVGFDELMISWDLTFKDTAGTDMVVGQVWGRRGIDCYLLDQRRARMDFVATATAVETLAAIWPQALLKLIEDKANGPAVIAMLRRKIPGIVPEEPQGSKTARASAVSPLIEAGNVWLPSPAIAPWIEEFVEECAAFPNGAHDDQVDAMSQALNRLIVQPLVAGDGWEQPEEYDMVDQRGWYASPV